MKKLIPILLSALLFTGCASSNNPTNSYRQITMDEAVTMMAQETGCLIIILKTLDMSQALWYCVMLQERRLRNGKKKGFW